MKQNNWIAIMWVGLCLAGLAWGVDKNEQAETESEKKEDKQELKLEDLFPEKSLFGPSASGMAFSYDGKYAAYLYKPYKERRHGNDLHIYDVEKDQVKRITWASVMAKFQKSTRKVVEDRIEKAKKEKPPAKDDKEGDADDTENDKEETETKTSQPDPDDDDQEDVKEESGAEQGCQKEEDLLKKRGDWVSDKDADDEKAPRYTGVRSFAWSPTAQEILLSSEGDIYLYRLATQALTRLTHTRDRETSCRWLQHGKGYTFQRGSALFRRVFADDVTRQLDPKFPNGDSLQRHRISPDGRHIAFLTRKQIETATSSKVEIANYRDRLMKAKEVSRHVSDDKLAVTERRIYLYEISDEPDEKDTLTEVFKFETHMPDDMLKTPVWSPNSEKVAFFSFEQDPALIKIFEATIAEEDEDAKEANGKDKSRNKDEDKDSDKAQEDDDKASEESETDPNEPEDEPAPAQEIYRFLHHGGPNTPRMMELHYLADNQHIAYLSEQSGFRHLQVLDPLYESIRPLTSGPYEVYPIDISKDRQWIFVQATKEDPATTDVYRIATKTGRMTRLTQVEGTHSQATVSQDGTRVLANLVSYERLKELIFIDTQADVHKTLTDSHPEKARKFAEPQPDFFNYKNRHGHTLHGMMFKPDDWTKKDKCPVLIYFYGGPLGTRKMVVQGSFSGSSYAFAYYMAKKHGFVTCTIDTRGNSGYAGVFEKANFGQVGKPQVEDLVDGVTYLVDKHGVDKERVAIHGWSFGGFQTQMCMYTEPNVFQAGIAGAGPTEWENYNSWYTRHTIGKSDPGKATLKEFSLLPLAKNLKGHLLLVHGMEDSNVLYQDTVRVYRELLKAGKETLVELFLDPTGGHGLKGDVKSLSQYRKYEQFLLRTVGKHEPAKADAAEKERAKPKKKRRDRNRKKTTGRMNLTQALPDSSL